MLPDVSLGVKPPRGSIVEGREGIYQVAPAEVVRIAGGGGDSLEHSPRLAGSIELIHLGLEIVEGRETGPAHPRAGLFSCGRDGKDGAGRQVGGAEAAVVALLPSEPLQSSHGSQTLPLQGQGAAGECSDGLRSGHDVLPDSGLPFKRSAGGLEAEQVIQRRGAVHCPARSQGVLPSR